jgi:hypothetical protein
MSTPTGESAALAFARRSAGRSVPKVPDDAGTEPSVER